MSNQYSLIKYIDTYVPKYSSIHSNRTFRINYIIPVIYYYMGQNIDKWHNYYFCNCVNCL